jgi:hypothetical protein
MAGSICPQLLERHLSSKQIVCDSIRLIDYTILGLLAIVLIERLQETVKKEIRRIHGFSKTIPTIMALFTCKYTYAKYGRV